MVPWSEQRSFFCGVEAFASGLERKDKRLPASKIHALSPACLFYVDFRFRFRRIREGMSYPLNNSSEYTMAGSMTGLTCRHLECDREARDVKLLALAGT
mmetsp:Transcript_56318/g.119877  ORF Transcript_56318/g.119877 Transcript_56318/m.119877 type:complete len:99 (+) Transcript_56318:1458-1754(+)